MVEPLDLRARFERDGILHIKGFASGDECDGMRRRMAELIDHWDPHGEDGGTFSSRAPTNHQSQSNYFLDSADRIHFFLEAEAAGEDGKLKPGLQKAASLNKVGHGLHVADDVFKTYSHSQKVADLVAELGWRDPVLPQTMYIFKQPRIGERVTAHQDSSFLATTPTQTCLGLWLALHPATLENGCLWARPGSHKEAVRRLFVRNPAFFDGDASAPIMVFEANATTGPADSWEGVMPEDIREKGFEPLECEEGDLVVIHGQVDHLSLANTSDKKRETFQLHLVEGPTQGITWSERNWLQYPEGRQFPSLLARPPVT